MAIRVSIASGMLAVVIGLTIAISADMSKRTANIIATRNELAARASSIKRLVELRAQANQAVPYANGLEEILPKSEKLISFPREVRTLAAEQGVTIPNISLGTEIPTSGNEPGSIEVQFSVAGTFKSFTSFLKALEERAGFIAFSSIDAPITNRVNAAVKANVFTQ